MAEKQEKSSTNIKERSEPFDGHECENCKYTEER